MNEIDAFMKIAEAIHELALAVESINFTLWLFLIFKKMG